MEIEYRLKCGPPLPLEIVNAIYFKGFIMDENKKSNLEEEYAEATDTIQDLIDILKDTKKRLEKSSCPHAIAAGAWLEQALENNKTPL